jgi:pSer/pThr/pTyr-binding forkhead associated (FHA) protein
MLDKSVQPQKEHFFLVEDDKGKTQILLTEPIYSIGRALDCDICLRSQFISRHHATLLRQINEEGETYYRLVDGDGRGRSSANGFLINGQKRLSQDLVHEDEVIFGPQVFAIYQYRQRDRFPTLPSNDPFDITLIDPAMMIDEEDAIESN